MMPGKRQKPMPAYTMAISLNIKAIRQHYGLSQKGMADRLGCSPALIGWWETNRSLPSAEMVVRICYEFGVSADRLLGVPREWVKIK